MFFGVFYSCLGQVGGSSGWWPVLAARLVSLSALGIVTTARHVPLVMPRRFTLVVIASGVLDVLGNVCYTIATRHTYLSTTATLVSLYPAATIVLARIVLSERLRPRQLAGLAAALTSIICMTAFR
jgi:drug/metabolite transporter (DMT)-like permease